MRIIEPFRAAELENTAGKISVIVTIYNIKPYLERCVTSIREQTYSNLEIILVDDGSTDGSGAVCDRLAEEDKRIVVIHKQNGGPSEARNVGTKAATGEYIAYVDGDDWIDKKMYQSMLYVLKTYNADIAVCRYRCILPQGIKDDSTEKIVVFEGREALKAHIEEEEAYQIQNAAWNKLYRRDFAQEVQFAEGKLYEDIVYTAKLLSKAKRTVYLDKAYYNYVMNREGSIMTAGVSGKTLSDQIPAYFERSKFLVDIGERALAETHDYFVCKRLLLVYTEFTRLICHSKEGRSEKRKNLKKLREVILSLEPRFEAIYRSPVANPNEKKKMEIFLFSPKLYQIAMWLNDRMVVPYKVKRNLKAEVEHLHVVQMMGGLGNQMFQYALYRQLKAQGKLVKLDDETGYRTAEAREKHLQKAFELTYDRPTKAEMELLTDSSLKLISRVRRKLTGRKSKSFRERQFNFDAEVFNLKAAYYEGYWQSEKYFEKIAEQIREDFSFQCEIPEESRRYLDKIEAVNAVSIHIRRGDYLNEEQRKVFGGICTAEYYRRAIAMIKDKVLCPHFFVFTNDPQWVKKHLQGDEFEVVDCNDESKGYLDMLLMSHCQHHIIANSSFSWWGAWLGKNPEKLVIAPAVWINGRDCGDIYTPQMIVLDGKLE